MILSIVRKHRIFWMFLVLFSLILVLRQYAKVWLLNHAVDGYIEHVMISVVSNIGFIILAYVCMRKTQLMDVLERPSELSKVILLMAFPTVYLCGLNVLTLDPIDYLSLSTIIFLCADVLLVGFSEELCIRGFLLLYCIKYFSSSQSVSKHHQIICIFYSSLFFSVLHLIVFDKGLYGELAQLVFAMIVGLLFGVLLLRLNRLYPLILAHAANNFCAKLDSAGQPIVNHITSLENSVFILIIMMPCLAYSVILMRKLSMRIV